MLGYVATMTKFVKRIQKQNNYRVVFKMNVVLEPRCCLVVNRAMFKTGENLGSIDLCSCDRIYNLCGTHRETHITLFVANY
ncbi:hypothetical protein VCUG_02836 [Vavraia culicis subsp. floridensis]|uniref:Uncharacterized protein n=1 Tax=Vavraia culicis (isolate floridensis) TaxID=948595 RepID=A0A024RE30_VAVCU|nr:uncharacterized protein VCUG_02836 [Vavraia culicis subsp. floridensis]ETA55718.1 hypothetical protein VCUG_02836 [Vavraia culicis subsp. floridensis]